jgi:hypothetical protein
MMEQTLLDGFDGQIHFVLEDFERDSDSLMERLECAQPDRRQDVWIWVMWLR